MHVYMTAGQSHRVEAANKAVDVIAAAMDDHAWQVPRAAPGHGTENSRMNMKKTQKNLRYNTQYL